MVILSGTVSWFSNEFLLSKMPQIARQIEKNPEQSNVSIRQSYHQNKVQNLNK